MPHTYFNRLLQEKTETFVMEVAELVKLAALESVGEALGVNGSVSPGHRSERLVSRTARQPERRKKGKKRSPESLERLTETLLESIRSGPGRRIEEIARELETGTKELALPARKLLDAGRIKTTGQKRATKYFARR